MLSLHCYYFIVGISTCVNDPKYQLLYIIAQNLTTQFYVSQTIMLIGILYYRLYFVFKGTVQSLSCINITIFIICYLFTSISFIFAGYMYANYMTTIGPSIIALVSILVIFMIIYLVSIFISKLINVYKKSQVTSSSDDKYLANVITKVSLLTFISTSNVIISAISSGLRPVFNSVHWDLFFTVIINIDIFSNFLCVYLSEKYFKKWYIKMCGCCHIECTKCWNFCLGNNMDIKNMLSILREGTITMATRPSVNRTRTSVMSGISVVSAVSSCNNNHKTHEESKHDGDDDALPPRITKLRTHSSFETDQESDIDNNTLKVDVNDANISAPPSRRPSLSTIVGSPNMDDIVIDDAEIVYNDCPNPIQIGDYQMQQVDGNGVVDIDMDCNKQLEGDEQSEIDAIGIVQSLQDKVGVLQYNDS